MVVDIDPVAVARIRFPFSSAPLKLLVLRILVAEELVSPAARLLVKKSFKGRMLHDGCSNYSFSRGAM